jgi:hypothetical protein
MTPEQTAELRGIVREMRLEIQKLVAELQRRQDARKLELERRRARLRRLTFGVFGRV